VNTGGQQGGGEEAKQKRQHEVVRGDNLWLIAKERLAAARSGGSGEPTNREVARYWIKVVEANKHHLRSGNPDLIYPDEEIILPPVGD
jgi:nucleoid-associated protein YgaU